MSQSTAIAIQKIQDQDKIMEQVIIKGDVSDLTPAQRVSYCKALCRSLKLNPLTKPFDFLEITDKKTQETRVVIYANKTCAAQLKKNHQVSIWKTESRIENGILIVTAYAKTPDGQVDIDEGAVYVGALMGDPLCNARMKAVTKAKRRVTLSICGLGFLDESEIETIPGARPLPPPELEAVMTESEAIAKQETDDLILTYKQSPLDQWKCGRDLAMQLLNVCEALKKKGIDEELMRSRLPGGVQSRKDLTPEQAEEAIKAFRYWLNSYNEAVEGKEVGND